MHIDENGNQIFEDLDDIRAFFAGDEFATKCLGAQIDSFDWETSTAVVSMTIDDRHHNGQGFVMGGVFFSLCDYALAISCNVGQRMTASIECDIKDMSRAKGERLIATARPIKAGRSIGFFEISLTDELGSKVAHMTATVMRTSH